MTIYLDTSAAAKLIVDEAESEALAGYLDSASGEPPLISSILLETELRRVCVQHGLDQSLVTDVLDAIELIEADRAIFVDAGLLPGRNLRSLDALHIATALRTDAEVVVTYDTRMAEATRAVGLRVVAPS